MISVNEAKRRYYREWYNRNKDCLSEYLKQWRADNPEKAAAANERVKQWQKDNPDKVKANQQRCWERKAAAMEIEE